MTEGSHAQPPQQSQQPEPLNAPLLAKVRTRAPATLLVERRDGGSIVVDLGPSIAAPGSEFAALQDRTVFVEAKVDELNRLVALVDSAELSVDVAQRVPLSGLPAIHARAAAGEVHGKIVAIPA